LFVAGIVLFALAVVIILILSNLPKTGGSVVVPTLYPAPQAQFNNMGDPNAPVKIVEYSDFQCPYCAKFWQETEGQLIDTYVKTGKVYFTYRSMGNFISGDRNQESADSAMAAYCAGDQNQFWAYHDTLFANQKGENAGTFSRSFLKAIAQRLGLDTNAFNNCLDTNKYAQKVQQDSVDGSAAITGAPNFSGSGIGTPSFLVNGKLLTGAQPIEAFQQEIEAVGK
jgi:protein-disulfide isomerase